MSWRHGPTVEQHRVVTKCCDRNYSRNLVLTTRNFVEISQHNEKAAARLISHHLKRQTDEIGEGWNYSRIKLAFLFNHLYRIENNMLAQSLHYKVVRK
jgi:hypothetical protein